MTHRSESGDRTETLTIEYPADVLWALRQQPQEFADEARLLLAVKLYETGKLSTGLAARFCRCPARRLQLFAWPLWTFPFW
jgi:hypothetical protein